MITEIITRTIHMINTRSRLDNYSLLGTTIFTGISMKGQTQKGLLTFWTPQIWCNMCQNLPTGTIIAYTSLLLARMTKLYTWHLLLFISHNMVIKIHLNMSKPPRPTTTISFRKIRAIDQNCLTDDIWESEILRHLTMEIETMVCPYKSTLMTLPDKHARLKSKTQTAETLMSSSSKYWGAVAWSALKCTSKSCTATYICGSGPVCAFIVKCSRWVKILLKIPLPLLNVNIIIKRSKHPREIKGLFSVLWIKYYIKVKLSSQIISTQIKIWPIVLITSSVKKY